MATYEEIKCFAPLNDTDKSKVMEIARSIQRNGWQGAPILYTESGLVTGSHRIAALRWLARNDEDFDEEIECAEDVTDIIENYCIENETDEIPYDNLGEVFSGTWVEAYKNEIAEW